MALPLKTFYFLRHGETDWNRRHIYMGSQDIPLNENGEKQARTAGIILAKENSIKHIFVSPLIRAYKTAEIININLQINMTILPELAECGWGEYEGKAVDDGTILKNWLNGNPHPGAEPIKNFEVRVMQGFNQALSYYQEPVLIVAHGGVYCVIQRILNLPFINIRNCAPIFHRPPDDSNQAWFACTLEE